MKTLTATGKKSMPKTQGWLWNRYSRGLVKLSSVMRTAIWYGGRCLHAVRITF